MPLTGITFTNIGTLGSIITGLDTNGVIPINWGGSGTTSGITQDPCYDAATILSLGGQIVENSGGTVTVYIPQNGQMKAVVLTKPCCEALNTGYTFDIDTQTCLWSQTGCTIEDIFKITLNPAGNDGAFFFDSDAETCVLKVSYDYLFNIDCKTLDNVRTHKINGPVFLKNNPNNLVNILTQIENEQAFYDSLTNQINVLMGIVLQTPYSVICQTPNINLTAFTGGNLTQFGNTGFGTIGNLTLLTGGTLTTAITQTHHATMVRNKNYCLTEPQGLSVWATILGPIRYAKFLNGDATSYTCADVQALLDANETLLTNNPNAIALVDICNVAFGTKTTLLTQLQTLTTIQTKTAQLLSGLTASIAEVDVNQLSETIIGCDTPINVFESLDVSMSIDVVTSANTLEPVYYDPSWFPAIGIGNLYQYLLNNPQSGFYVCGDSGSGCTPFNLNLQGLESPNDFYCDEVLDLIVDDLFAESGYPYNQIGYNKFTQTLSNSAFTSNWRHFSTTISDPTVIKKIANKKIKLTLYINFTCGDVCIWLDNIVLEKVCTRIDRNDIFVTQCPGFELDRVIDNKKSWFANHEPVNRFFKITDKDGLNTIRLTDYDVNDERLVINSKEIDLDMGIASAIETDVWCYLIDNPCLLTGETFCSPCDYKQFQDGFFFHFQDDEKYQFEDQNFTGDGPSDCCGDNMIQFDDLLSEPLSDSKTIEMFEVLVTSELIDAKNRQTISAYPTMRALYDRYMTSRIYCGSDSSKFDYITLEQFAGLLGDYWVDLVEQVIPSTTIWGSVKIYSNTIFDQQKYKYRAYTSFFCSNPFSGETVLSPINGTSGQCTTAEAIITQLPIPRLNKKLPKKQKKTVCQSVCLSQMNMDSEFIGSVAVLNSLLIPFDIIDIGTQIIVLGSGFNHLGH